jgi:hypothetical protein
MSDGRMRISDLRWIQAYRKLMLQKAEHDAKSARGNAAKKQTALNIAKSVRIEVHERCLDLARSGQNIDLVLAQLWSAELQRCQQKESEAEHAAYDANEAVETAKLDWRKALMLADAAEKKFRDQSRLFEESKERDRLADTEEIFLSRKLVQ